MFLSFQMFPFLFIIITLLIVLCSGHFSPRTSDYDAYGLRITGNDIMLVEALCDSQVFLIRLAPYNSTSQSLQCPIAYNDSSHYVYSVGIGEQQNVNQSYFFYAGEIISTRASSDRQGAFIGILVNKDRHNAQIYEDTQTIFNCNYFEYESFEFITSYDHQEFFVFGVEPYGQYAIGLTKDYLFIYRPFSNNKMTVKNASLIWPDSTTFIPIAVDTDGSYTVVAGFILNGPLFRVRATPTVYVLSNSDLTVLANWSYTAALDSWQSHLTYSDLKTWSSKYVMSVNINPEDPTQILVGMSFINFVSLLIVSVDGKELKRHSFIDSGDSNGFGKSVTWLSNSRAAILSSNFPTDDSSKIYLYTSLNNLTLPSSPAVTFPNIQQPLPTIIGGHLIRMISTPTSLAILNINSEILLIESAPAGYFASTNAVITDSIVTVSRPMMCMAGTYKSDSSIFPCSLCPSGSRNPGDIAASSCIICSSNSFCPIGSVSNIDQSVLFSRSQAHVHPRSPEVIVFDEILLQNMFSTGSNDHCIFTSPLFWVLLVIGIVLIILLVMFILKRFVQHPHGHKVRKHVKRIFRQTDLLNEGEMWVGGLISFAIIVLLIFAYTFSAAFYQNYPSETSDLSQFACNEFVRNVKYESGLQSLSIRPSKEEQPMFNLLNQQHLAVRLDLLNTIASCKSLSVEQVFGSSTVQLFSTCSNSNGILSVIVELPYQKTIIKWILNDIALIGGIRVGLSGYEREDEFYRLKKLDFSRTFYDHFNRTLSQTTTMNLELTKAINETEPLAGRESKFSGIWYPKFIIDRDHMFITSEEYATSANLTSTRLTMIISETSYYIKNRQLPIAKLREIIFHNLLFTIVCLEIFRLILLLWKLTFLPLLNFFMRHFQKTKEILSAKLGSIDREMTKDNHSTTTDIPSAATTIIEDNQSTITEDYNVVKLNYL